MPYKYLIISEKNLIYVKALEPATLLESKELLTNISENVLFDPAFRMLVDCTNIHTSFSVGEAQLLGIYLGDFQTKIIVIVASNDLIFGMGRLLGAYAEPVGVTVIMVRNFESAKKSLELEGITLPNINSD